MYLCLGVSFFALLLTWIKISVSAPFQPALPFSLTCKQPHSKLFQYTNTPALFTGWGFTEQIHGGKRTFVALSGRPCILVFFVHFFFYGLVYAIYVFLRWYSSFSEEECVILIWVKTTLTNVFSSFVSLKWKGNSLRCDLHVHDFQMPNRKWQRINNRVFQLSNSRLQCIW